MGGTRLVFADSMASLRLSKGLFVKKVECPEKQKRKVSIIGDTAKKDYDISHSQVLAFISNCVFVSYYKICWFFKNRLYATLYKGAKTGGRALI